eukprot:3536715-Pleurochrysis_carterae.AAC.1
MQARARERAQANEQSLQSLQGAVGFGEKIGQQLAGKQREVEETRGAAWLSKSLLYRAFTLAQLAFLCKQILVELCSFASVGDAGDGGDQVDA